MAALHQARRRFAASAAGPARPRLKKGDDGERKCLATGALLDKSELIRFVIGPDHAVVPDLAGDLPGRGLWVAADAAAIGAAAAKNLFAKAAQASARPQKDLAALTAQLLQARCLSLLGLAKSAGIAILGEAQVAQAVKQNGIGTLLLAADASVDFDGFIAWRKGEDMDKGRGLAVARRFTRQELGAALGYEQIVYAALKPHKLAAKFNHELARLEKLAPMAHSNPSNEK